MPITKENLIRRNKTIAVLNSIILSIISVIIILSLIHIFNIMLQKEEIYINKKEYAKSVIKYIDKI